MEDKNREQLKGLFATIFGNLRELSDTDIKKFFSWMMRKSKLYADAIQKTKFNILPDKLVRGDIVFCSFGTNIYPEFSDKETEKHYAIIWLQQGYNFVVIPITKQGSKTNNPYSVPLGKIPNMPAEENYAKLDAIRSVSIRRISRVSGVSGGKIVCPQVKERVNDALYKLFIDK